MSKDVKQFAKDMRIIPRKLSLPLYQAVSAGVDIEGIFEGFLKTSRMAAKGGKSDMETAVDVLSSTVNAYGEEVLDATEASDLMFVAIRNGKTDFNQLASSLYNVVPIAQSLGVEFGNITAAIATMTAKGTPTAQATTQIRQLLVELSKEGMKASHVFQQAAGKTFKEFIAEGHNLQDALMYMEAAAQKLNLGVNDLFGSVEAGNAALTLTGEGAKRFTRDLNDMANPGATEGVLQRMSNNINSLWKAFMQDGMYGS